MPAVSAVVIDGEVDGPEVLVEVHEADGTWVRERVPISLYITYSRVRYSSGMSSSIDTILFSN